MTNKCELCKNKKICKYKEGYKSLADKIKEMFKDTKADEVLSVELDCKYYEKEKQLSTQEIEQLLNRNTPTSILDNITLTEKHRCEGCYVYEKIKKKAN